MTMRIKLLPLMIFFSFKTIGQNHKIIASTSLGLISNVTRVEGLGATGFSTTTSVEYKVSEKLWLTGTLDFQSISYLRTVGKLAIDGSLTTIPILIGGKYFLNTQSKFRPFIAGSMGISFASIPNASSEAGKITLFSDSKFPFTYLLGVGLEWQAKPTFFPYIEVDYQSISNNSAIFSNNPSYIPIRIGVRTYPF